MKKKIIKNPTKTEVPIMGLTNPAGLTQQAAMELFVKSYKKKPDSQNDYVDIFVRIMDIVLQTQKSFSVNEVANASRPFDIPIKDVESLFHAWTNCMLDINRVQLVPSVYDDDLYVWR